MSTPLRPDFLRLFVAVNVPAPIRSDLAGVQDALRELGVRVSWVPERNIHVSLAFLGDVPAGRVGEIQLALDECAAAGEPFSLTVQGIGSFGSPRSPRVIWAGVAPCPELHALQGRVADAVDVLELLPDRRAFQPHLTLGRVRSSRGAARIPDAMQAWQQKVFGYCRVTSVDLMRSILQPAGARYSILHAAALQDTATGRRAE